MELLVILGNFSYNCGQNFGFQKKNRRDQPVLVWPSARYSLARAGVANGVLFWSSASWLL